VTGIVRKTFLESGRHEGLLARLDWNSLISRDHIETLGIAHSNLAPKVNLQLKDPNANSFNNSARSLPQTWVRSSTLRVCTSQLFIRRSSADNRAELQKKKQSDVLRFLLRVRCWEVRLS
jgi:hypothetical protein